jgi:sporulation protein YlmC with PRC-barrel domain
VGEYETYRKKEVTMKMKQWTKPLVVGLTVPTLMLASTAFAAQSDKTMQRTQTTTQQEHIKSRQATDAHIYRASQLVGADVENAQGNNLGEIYDVVIDPADGSIAYAVLAAGGFLGMGEKFFAIPWRAFQPRVDDDGEIEEVILNVEKDRFQDAPGFDKGQWPDMANPQWGQTVHAYYGQQDYWERRQAMRQAGKTNMNTQSSEMQHEQTTGSATVQKVSGNTVELQISQDLLKDLQAGDRVEVSVQKQSETGMKSNK